MSGLKENSLYSEASGNIYQQMMILIHFSYHSATLRIHRDCSNWWRSKALIQTSLLGLKNEQCVDAGLSVCMYVRLSVCPCVCYQRTDINEDSKLINTNLDYFIIFQHLFLFCYQNNWNNGTRQFLILPNSSLIFLKLFQFFQILL